MVYSINPIATIYKLDGTELIKCNYAAHTEKFIHLTMSLSEFLTLSSLHEDVMLMLTSPILGLMPYICTPLPESLVSTDALSERDLKLSFMILEKKKNIQRRRDFKVKTDIPIRVQLTEPLTGECDGKIADISAAGILFTTEMKLENGQEFTFLLQETKIPTTLTARILHQYENGKKKHYGCRLQEVSKSQEEMLRQYVFWTEAMRRQKLATEEPDDNPPE